MGRRPETTYTQTPPRIGLTRGADEVVHVAEHLAHRVEDARRCDRVRHDAPPLLLPVVDGRALVASPEGERVELLHFRRGEVLAVPRQRVAEVGVVVGVTVVVASPTPTGGGDGPSAVIVVGLLLGVEHAVQDKFKMAFSLAAHRRK
jgi:hypothetical protein